MTELTALIHEAIAKAATALDQIETHGVKRDDAVFEAVRYQQTALSRLVAVVDELDHRIENISLQ